MRRLRVCCLPLIVGAAPLVIVVAAFLAGRRSA